MSAGGGRGGGGRTAGGGDSTLYVAVIGSGDATDEQIALAEQVGKEVARAGAVLVCGGLGGVMEAACRGAKARAVRRSGYFPALTARRPTVTWTSPSRQASAKPGTR